MNLRPHSPSSRRMRPALWLALAVLLGSASAVQSQTAPAADPGFAAAIFDTLHSGRWEQALVLLRQYTPTHPGDALSLYNQACLENRAGDADAARATLRRALDAGFAEMDFALRDPDLKGVADDPGLFAVAPAAGDSLLRRSLTLGRTLDFETWSAPIALDTGDSTQPGCSVRLRWLEPGLRVEITAPKAGDQLAGSNPPWLGGTGVVVNLVVPDSSAAYAGGTCYTFAGGTEEDLPGAAIYLPRQERWQRISDADPKFATDAAGRMVFAFTLPWPAIMPFSPLADPVLGLNVAVRRPTSDGAASSILMPDPWAWAPGAALHRYAPLRFDPESIDREAVAGRLPDSVVGNGPLKVHLTVISPEAGDGRLSVAFNDPAAQPVLREQASTQDFPLQKGVNHLSRTVDFTTVPTGPYLLRVGIRFPTGKEKVWGTPVLKIDPGWLDGLQEQVDKLPAAEKPTVRSIRAAIERELADHRPRSNPGPAARTIQDLLGMLTRAAATGSIMPDRGSVSLVYPGPDDRQRLCTLYLTPDSTGARRTLPVLVLHRAAAREGFLVDRIARNVEFGKLPALGADDPRPIYAVPHPENPQAAESASEAEARACLDWCLDFLDADRAVVVGIDAAGADALRLAVNEPRRIARTLVFAGHGLAPWPGADDAHLKAELTPVPSSPVRWVDFPWESGQDSQGPRLLAMLKSLGWRVTDSTVPGGLSLSQAADRLVLWTVAPDSLR